MRESIIELRVRYPEVDRMGVVHHTHYLTWFEMGRTELMRELGCPYGDMEKAGVFMPVIEAFCKYFSPVRYDEVVQVETRLKEVTRSRVFFEYRLRRAAQETKLAEGHTVHAAANGNGRAIRLPETYRQLLMPS